MLDVIAALPFEGASHALIDRDRQRPARGARRGPLLPRAWGTAAGRFGAGAGVETLVDRRVLTRPELVEEVLEPPTEA